MKKNTKTISLDELKESSVFKHYTNFESLGEGANAKTFKAKHKVLEQYAVIKVYAIFEKDTQKIKDKHRDEIKKNAKFRLTKNQAVVFDAGTIKIGNDEYLYSIMNYLEGISLKEWLKRRKKFSCRKTILRNIEINAALGFLYACYNLINNDLEDDLTHGDLNEGNVIFLKQLNYSAGNSEFSRYCSSYGHYLVPTAIEFIDYGTSQWEDTKKEVGIQRDLKFIFDNTKKILSSYPIENFINYDEILEFNKDEFKKEYRVHYLIIDLIRVIISLDFLESISNISGFEENLEGWLFKLWHGEFKWDDSFEFNNFRNLEYWKALKKPSWGKYINEKAIIDYINKQQQFTISFNGDFRTHTFKFK